jgi:hypothetical protein
LKKRLVFFILAALLLSACNLPQPESPDPCGRKNAVNDLIQRSDVHTWSGWIEDLSGARAVTFNGQTQTITSRFSWAMFTGQPNARAFDYVLSLIKDWVSPSQVEVLPYVVANGNPAYPWKNLVVTFPGKVRPEETVYLTAHLDSIIVHDGDPMLLAPGADDNASGAAALLEAVRLLGKYRFTRTIKVVFFTGEEEFEAGSSHFTSTYPLGSVVGDINLDMIGYNPANDRILQIHAGTLPASQLIVNCMLQVNQAYQLNLVPEIITTDSSIRSDQASFWLHRQPAVWLFDGFDKNLNVKDPFYHRPSDTFKTINNDYGFRINQAALATAASLAVPLR